MKAQVNFDSLGGGYELGEYVSVLWNANSGVSIPTTKKAKGFVGAFGGAGYNYSIYIDDTGLMYQDNTARSGYPFTISDNAISTTVTYSTSRNNDVKGYVLY